MVDDKQLPRDAGEDILAAPAKPPMPTALEGPATMARKRVSRLPTNPGVIVEELDGRVFSAPHANEEDWRYQILDAFGTQSLSAAEVFLSQLSDLFLREWNDNGPERSQLLLNAALAIVNGMRPRTEVEACLAAQMVAVHIMAMRLAGRALISYEIDLGSAALASKLARTFAMQTDTLRQLRRRSAKQSFRIDRHTHTHQHVHVTGGAQEYDDQAHEPRLLQRTTGRRSKSINCGTPTQSSKREALPSNDAARDVMPSAGHKD